jgi:hypothetical protein
MYLQNTSTMADSVNKCVLKFWSFGLEDREEGLGITRCLLQRPQDEATRPQAITSQKIHRLENLKSYTGNLVWNVITPAWPSSALAYCVRQ